MNEGIGVFPYPRRRSFEIEPSRRDDGPFDPRYWLPEEVAFCSECVITNQRPNSAGWGMCLDRSFIRRRAGKLGLEFSVTF